uniref:Reverse transcriptase domain-containing protein n=1 Tax=Arundo donax TaxID=35708 RepID=A0A0A9D8Y1_ARUDO
MMGHFRCFLDEKDVKEIPFLGRKYTWSNERSSLTLVQLDLVFCSIEWDDIFPYSLLQSAAFVVSDHCPLLLGLRVNTKGKRRFHFESFWPHLPGFQEAVKANWNTSVDTTCPIEVVFLKLQRLSRGLQSWSQRRVGNIRVQLGMAKGILHKLEIARDVRPLSSGEEWLCKKLKHHCLGLASLECTIARLRSRVLYLCEGDVNTSFFHQQARYRKKKNFVPKLKVEDRVVTNQEDKQRAVFYYYVNLLGTATQRASTLNLEDFHSRQHDLNSLEVPFTATKVWSTVKDLPLDKAPGPDGFTGQFYQTCWPIIQEDIMRALLAVQHSSVSKLRLLNIAFITLLPKKPDTIEVKDFWPISLIHSFAKLVTKLMANRLAPKLSEKTGFSESKCLCEAAVYSQ